MLIFITSYRHRLAKILAILAVFGVALYFAIVRPAMAVVDSFGKTLEAASYTVSLASEVDLEKFSVSLTPLRSNLTQTKKRLNYFRFASIIPIVGGAYGDLRHLTVASEFLVEASEIAAESLKPKLASLGLEPGAKVESSKRIEFLVSTLITLVPDLDKLTPQVRQAKQEMAQVNPGRYSFIPGLGKVAKQIQNSADLIDQVEFFLVEARPLLLVLPEVAGFEGERNYLVLFQNDKEIRPSGGFLTAYTFVKLSKGAMTQSGSNDIYALDEAINYVCQTRICNLAPPTPIVKYLPEPTGEPKQAIESRDSNLSPDWAVAVAEFERFYRIAGSTKIDGIIVVDTFFIKSLLEVLGPVNVGGYTTTFTAENIVDELLGYASVVFAGQRNRKAILGDLMNSIRLTILQSPKSAFGPLVATILNSAGEKHVLFNFKNAQAQEAFEKLNWAGRIVPFDGDYLHINDANFAGGKANLFVTEEIFQNIQVASDGTVTKEVQIIYRNPEKFSKLNPGYRDWVRIYTPAGSKLLDGSGSTDGVRESEDLGKTVFDGFIIVRPEGTVTFTVKYQLPFKVTKGEPYKLLIQKQPGTDGFVHNIKIDGRQVEKPFKLITDREFTWVR